MYEVCSLLASREYHKDAITLCDAFVKGMSGKRERVYNSNGEGTRKTIHNDKKKLCSITEIIVCVVGRSLLSVAIVIMTQIWEVYKQQAPNYDNFCDLLNFRISAGDTILRDQRQSAARNATYTSLDIQNNLINILVTTFVMQS